MASSSERSTSDGSGMRSSRLQYGEATHATPPFDDGARTAAGDGSDRLVEPSHRGTYAAVMDALDILGYGDLEVRRGFEGLTPDEWRRVGVTRRWSPKDLLAHL